MEIGKLLEIYVTWVVLTNVHLGFGDPPQFFIGGKTEILGKIFDKVLKWRLTIPQLGGMWEIKKRRIYH